MTALGKVQRYLAGLGVAVTCLAAACAPPVGLGQAPVRIPEGKTSAGMSAGGGAASSRERYQVDGSMAGRFTDHLGLELGLTYAAMRLASEASDAHGDVIAMGVIPWGRPTLYFDSVQVGVGLSGFGMGGGGGGLYYGFVAPRIAYVAPRFSVWGEWMAHASNMTGDDNPHDGSSQQFILGGLYEWSIDDGKGHLGARLELGYIDQSFLGGGLEMDSRSPTAIFKLQIRRDLKM